MSKIYLHIGIEKTGSTAIQDYLWKYRASLFSAEKAYPDGIFENANHMEISSLFIERRKLINMTVPKDIFAFRDRLINFIKDNKENDLYFSSEHLSSRVVNSEDVKSVVDFFSSEGHDVVVIAFYRSPCVWIRSHYIQYISSGGVVSFSDYISTSLTESFIAETTNYSKSLLNWYYVLKDKNFEIVLLNFDFNKKDILREYCNAVDLEYVPDDNRINSNVSLLEGQAVVQRAFNRLTNSKRLKVIFKKIIINLNFNFLFLNWESKDLNKYLENQTSNLTLLLKISNKN